MAYRLGLDIGTNSIGWTALTIDAEGKPNGVLGQGVRIFSDGRNPKDGRRSPFSVVYRAECDGGATATCAGATS